MHAAAFLPPLSGPLARARPRLPALKAPPRVPRIHLATSVDPSAARSLLHPSAATKAASYLDVRTEKEYTEAHIPSSTNVPILTKLGPNLAFLQQVAAVLPDKTAPIVVGCKSGKRSAMAVIALEAAGYQNLHELTGGLDAWLTSGGATLSDVNE